jgi:hypothetical protein
MANNAMYYQNQNDHPELRKWSSHSNSTSRVIDINQIDHMFDSSKELFNLFSCFGYLTQILLVKNQNRALLEFSTFEAAQLCLEFIATAKVGHLTLRGNFSFIQTIDPSREIRPGLESSYDYCRFSEKHQRRSV